MRIILATNNKNKVREVGEILSPMGYEVISQSDAGIDIEVEENGTTFEENAFLKADAVHKLSGDICIADDSGLEVDYLNGEPGVYSARYAEPGHRCQKVLDKLEGVPEEIVEGLRANFTGECTEVGMYLAMARAAHREG